MQRIIQAMKDLDGIDGVILAGTELPLLLTGNDACGVPLLDTTQIHVAAAVKRLWVMWRLRGGMSGLMKKQRATLARHRNACFSLSSIPACRVREKTDHGQDSEESSCDERGGRADSTPERPGEHAR